MFVFFTPLFVFICIIPLPPEIRLVALLVAGTVPVAVFFAEAFDRLQAQSEFTIPRPEPKASTVKPRLWWHDVNAAIARHRRWMRYARFIMRYLEQKLHVLLFLRWIPLSPTAQFLRHVWNKVCRSFRLPQMAIRIKLRRVMWAWRIIKNKVCLFAQRKRIVVWRVSSRNRIKTLRRFRYHRRVHLLLLVIQTRIEVIIFHRVRVISRDITRRY